MRVELGGRGGGEAVMAGTETRISCQALVGDGTMRSRMYLRALWRFR
jgi:hypothetical protein